MRVDLPRTDQEPKTMKGGYRVKRERTWQVQADLTAIIEIAVYLDKHVTDDVLAEQVARDVMRAKMHLVNARLVMGVETC